ncbi:MAG: hypothetical protein AAF799_30840 [Myxococcota bacterium]
MTFPWEPRLLRRPNQELVTPGAKVVYSLTNPPQVIPRNSPDGYRREWFIITPFSESTLRRREYAGNRLEITWEDAEDPDSDETPPSIRHRITCKITRTDNEPPGAHWATTFQTVGLVPALHAMGRRMREQGLVEPADELQSLRNHIGLLEKIAEEGGVGRTVREAHERTMRWLRRQEERMEELFEPTDDFERIPIQARYLNTETQQEKALHVFLSPMGRRGNRRRWRLVDYSSRDGNVGNSFHDGEANDDHTAIREAIQSWNRGNRYAEGFISVEVPDTELTPLIQTRFRTDGETDADTLIRWLSWASLVLLPVSLGLGLAGRAVWAARALVVSTSSSSLAGVISIDQRWVTEGRNWSTTDSIDLVGVLGNLLGLAGARWMRRAMVSAPGRTPDVARLRYVVMAESATSVSEGLLLAYETYEEYQRILEDPRATPQDRMLRMIRLFANQAAAGGLAIFSFRGSRRDLRDLDGPPNHVPNEGDARDIETRRSELADEDAEVELDRVPGSEGHTDDGGRRTTVHTRPPAGAAPEVRMATLPDGTEIAPTRLGSNVFHGTDVDEATIRAWIENGLPERGSNMDLLAHQLGAGRVGGATDSAFRGTTRDFRLAAGLADEGGFVFELRNVDGWDVARELEGRVPSADPSRPFAGIDTTGETEFAILARVFPEQIVAVFRIGRRGRRIQIYPYDH